MKPEKVMIEILEQAAALRVPESIDREVSSDKQKIYEELIDSGYLIGTVLSDGSRPFHIGGCRITASGRIRLTELKERRRQSRAFFIRDPVSFVFGALFGGLLVHALRQWLP